jgi:hypothetical protein
MTNFFNTRNSNFTSVCPSIAAVKIAYIAVFGVENDKSVPFTVLAKEIQVKKPNTWKRFIRLSEVEAQNCNHDESYADKAARVVAAAAIEREANLARKAAL